MDNDQLTRIFCEVDDFCKAFERYTEGKLLPVTEKGKRGPMCCLRESEIMTVLIFFRECSPNCVSELQPDM